MKRIILILLTIIPIAGQANIEVDDSYISYESNNLNLDTSLFRIQKMLGEPYDYKTFDGYTYYTWYKGEGSASLAVTLDDQDQVESMTLSGMPFSGSYAVVDGSKHTLSETLGQIRKKADYGCYMDQGWNEGYEIRSFNVRTGPEGSVAASFSTLLRVGDPVSNESIFQNAKLTSFTLEYEIGAGGQEIDCKY